MKKLMIGALMFGMSIVANATPVTSSDEAYQVVETSVYKNKLTKLTKECIKYSINEDSEAYLVDIYEVHNKKCGGDPSVQHRLFSYSVDKKTGALATDAMREGVEWDGTLQPIQ